MRQQQTNFVQAAGNARRSQAALGYGVGSIIDFVTGSFMPLGLELQEHRAGQLGGRIADIKIYEPRLQRLLNVPEFRSAPIPSDKEVRSFGSQVERRYALPCTRFPEWLECPSCHRLGTIGYPFELQPNLHVQCPQCRIDVNPVRFIVCCDRGHIADFPWRWWAHRGVTPCENSRLYLGSYGRSASLADLYVECRGRNCKATRQSLESIFRKGELQKIGYHCPGSKPWLLRERESCDAQPLTVQRGGSNVYFPVTASMISIPPASEAVAQFLEPAWQFISSLPAANRDQAIEAYAQSQSIDRELAFAWVAERQRIDAGEGLQDERSARYQEYLALSRSHEAVEVGGLAPEFENSVNQPPEEIAEWFDLVAAVRRLREVRATCGFTRLVAMPLPAEAIPRALQERKITKLSRGTTTWLPAVELRGEGIFLRFREEALLTWQERNPGAVDRAATLNRVFATICNERGYQPPYRISARLLLIHSFAHALIRRVSLDCGYSSASLRERLYVADAEDDENTMCGVLIYTGTPDSDGSLGGLVAQASPGRLKLLIQRTIRDASWCASDPVCLETDPLQAADRVSGASCHSCLLVPETACEKFNRELDRTMLVGNGEDFGGFFTVEAL